MSKLKLEIDIETAERLALISLKDHQKYIKKEMKNFEKGAYMHPEDVVYNTRLLEAWEIVVKYYKG
jgi:hypothetical protein